MEYPIPPTLTLNGLESLKETIEQLCHCATEHGVYYGGKGYHLTAIDRPVYLDLQTVRIPTPGLVIQRIQVQPEHQGIGTRILDWLVDYCVSNGFDRIVMEQAMTDASHGFCQKHGFVEAPRTPGELLIDVYERNYELLLTPHARLKFNEHHSWKNNIYGNDF